MDSYSEARHYLEEFDRKLGEQGLEMEGVLIGQVALWEYAEREGEKIEGRETDDVDIYTPDILEAMELEEVYQNSPQQNGTRIQLDNDPETYMDLIWGHPMSEEFADVMESGEAETVEGLENLTLYVPSEEVYRTSKNRAGRKKDENDLEKLEKILR